MKPIVSPVEDAEFMARVQAIIWIHVANLLADPKFVTKALTKEVVPSDDRATKCRSKLEAPNLVWSRDKKKFYKVVGRIHHETEEVYSLANKNDPDEKRIVKFKTLCNRWKPYISWPIGQNA